ncbi:hypothetical protein K438DRAFT_1776494 [Mycena galopus ATCC 62051]|nr:hypothetical protein K438DRAFT_1776494 [Mycena galopus ATCC 62051]
MSLDLHCQRVARWFARVRQRSGGGGGSSGGGSAAVASARLAPPTTEFGFGFMPPGQQWRRWPVRSGGSDATVQGRWWEVQQRGGGRCAVMAVADLEVADVTAQQRRRRVIAERQQRCVRECSSDTVDEAAVEKLGAACNGASSDGGRMQRLRYPSKNKLEGFVAAVAEVKAAEWRWRQLLSTGNRVEWRVKIRVIHRNFVEVSGLLYWPPAKMMEEVEGGSGRRRCPRNDSYLTRSANRKTNIDEHSALF